MKQISNKTHDCGGLSMIMLVRLSRLKQNNVPLDTPVVLQKDGKELREYYYYFFSRNLCIYDEKFDTAHGISYGTLTLKDIIEKKVSCVRSQTGLRPGKYDYELIHKGSAIYLKYLE